jgi:hypothetical protein
LVIVGFSIETLANTDINTQVISKVQITLDHDAIDRLVKEKEVEEFMRLGKSKQTNEIEELPSILREDLSDIQDRTVLDMATGVALETLLDIPPNNTTPLPFRIKEKVQFFSEVLHAKPCEIDLVRNGHTPVWINNTPPARKHVLPPLHPDPLLHTTACKLELQGIIESTTESELVCMLPTRIKREEGGKERWLWDGRYVNECVVKSAYRMETAEVVRNMIEENAWGFHFDFTNAYFQGYIAIGARKYFGFATRDARGIIRFWRFIGWPQGYTLSSSL